MTDVKELAIHGHPLHSSKAIRAVIDDMRKTLADPTMALDMDRFCSRIDGVCHACAGGSAVIHGMGAGRKSTDWSDEEWEVADFYNRMRMDCFDGTPYPSSVQWAWSPAMMNFCFDYPDEFFDAWTKFADAVEAWEVHP